MITLYNRAILYSLKGLSVACHCFILFLFSMSTIWRTHSCFITSVSGSRLDGSFFSNLEMRSRAPEMPSLELNY